MGRKRKKSVKHKNKKRFDDDGLDEAPEDSHMSKSTGKSSTRNPEESDNQA